MSDITFTDEPFDRLRIVYRRYSGRKVLAMGLFGAVFLLWSAGFTVFLVVLYSEGEISGSDFVLRAVQSLVFVAIAVNTLVHVAKRVEVIEVDLLELRVRSGHWFWQRTKGYARGKVTGLQAEPIIKRWWDRLRTSTDVLAKWQVTFRHGGEKVTTLRGAEQEEAERVAARIKERLPSAAVAMDGRAVT